MTFPSTVLGEYEGQKPEFGAVNSEYEVKKQRKSVFTNISMRGRCTFI